MQLVPVDEAAGGHVPDLGVVLPAVPEPPYHLDVVGGLVEQVGDRGLGGQVLGEVDARNATAAEVVGLVGPGADPHPQSGPAAADVVEGGDRLGEVERLGVRGHHGRDEADVPGQRGDPGGDQYGVEPAAYLVGAVVGVEEEGGLEAEAVLDRDEVEQPPLGLGDLVGPVPGGEQLPGAGDRLAPGGGVPAGAVEGDGEMEGGGGGGRVGHGEGLPGGPWRGGRVRGEAAHRTCAGPSPASAPGGSSSGAGA